jgi:hypothetical protein
VGMPGGIVDGGAFSGGFCEGPGHQSSVRAEGARWQAEAAI